MNGTSYFLDTNAMIALLSGNAELELILQEATWIGTSVVCIIEFLSFPNLTPSDKDLLSTLLQRINLIPLESSFVVLERIAELRRTTKLKLPDAIIATSAIAQKAMLVSNDKHFNSVPNLSVQTF